jgi:UDP-2-acetamido-3-amino-2,3-dideoxy-glucuronate N-acetyltransferase
MIHNTAIIDNNVVIGENTKIWAYSHICSGTIIGNNVTIGEGVYIGPNVSIGSNTKIQNHSLIYEGVTIEDFVFLGPNTVTTNDYLPQVKGDWKYNGRFRKTIFKKGCSVGANCTIICGIFIGENSFVGAGSVVTNNVMDNWVVYGNPAKFKKLNTII